jgi:hypothetical protein
MAIYEELKIGKHSLLLEYVNSVSLKIHDILKNPENCNLHLSQEAAYYVSSLVTLLKSSDHLRASQTASIVAIIDHLFE